MRHRKHEGARVGTLVVTVLGAMALASSAQASDSASPDFYINGSAANLAAGFSGQQIGVSSQLMPGLNSETVCNKFSVAEGNLNSTKDASFKFLYEECVAREIGGSLMPLPGCNILVSAADKRSHITISGLILPAELTDGSPALLVEKLVSLVLFESGKGCILPTDNVIKGEACGKIRNNHAVKLEVEFSQEIQGLCRLRLTLEGEEGSTGVKDKMLYGTQEVFLDANWSLNLTGAHSGLTLGVLLLP